MSFTFDAYGRPVSGSIQVDAGLKQTVSAGSVVTATRADTAGTIELFVESGLVRVRTDGTSPTSTTGEPLFPHTWRSWRASSVKVLAIDEDAVITTISR